VWLRMALSDRFEQRPDPALGVAEAEHR